MLENIKTVALVLVLLSMGLTYQMWFGILLSKRALCRNMNMPILLSPAVYRILLLLRKLFSGRRRTCFQAGDKSPCVSGKENSVLEHLEEQTLKRISDSEKEALLRTASSKYLLFLTPLPVNFLMPRLTSLGLDIHRAVFILEEHYYYVILEGKDIFAGRIL